MRRVRAERLSQTCYPKDMCRRPALVNTMQRILFLGNLQHSGG